PSGRTRVAAPLLVDLAVDASDMHVKRSIAELHGVDSRPWIQRGRTGHGNATAHGFASPTPRRDGPPSHPNATPRTVPAARVPSPHARRTRPADARGSSSAIAVARGARRSGVV